MTKQEFATLVVAMQAMYGKDFIGTEEALDVWYALLHDLDYQIISKALQQYMLTNKFKPTVAELREIYTELVSPTISDWSDMPKDRGNRTRKNELKIYLSDNEKYILDRKVELSKRKSASDYIRTLILFGFVYDVDYSYLKQYNETLGKISGNLNQIAKRINSTGNVYEEDMAEVKAIMDEVWRTQKAMLKKQPLIHNG